MENLPSILLIWTTFIGKFVHSLGEGGVKWAVGCIIILARCENDFIRVHENLVQDPCNNISTIRVYFLANAIFILP